MKIKILAYLAAFTIQVSSKEFIINNKPLHIGVSITFATRSHIKYLLEILEDVSKKGHHVTYLSMNEMKSFGNGYNVTHYSLGDVKMTFSKVEESKPYTRGDSMFKNPKEMRQDLGSLYKASFPVYEKFYREEKPDLMVCDFNAEACVESAAKNSIPMVIGYQSLMFSYSSPFLTGNGVLQSTTIENFTFLQRMKHAFYDPINMLMQALPIVDLVQEERKLQDIPPIYKFPVFADMGIGIANSYIGLENPRNVPSHVYPIGPILSGDISSLPEELQHFMDSHSKVLYVAFGSLVKLPNDMLPKLLQHFQRAINGGVLDGVVWGLPKNNIELLPKSYKIDDVEYYSDKIVKGTHGKIKILKWAPQQSILNHPSTKLFLSHGGLESIYESMNAGVPMLILPFFSDQPRNAMLVTENGVGDYIEWNTTSDDQIYHKFTKLLDPNNLELKSKVRQMQLITKFSSKRKAMAANLIETYALSAKSCRQFSTPKPFKSPCEVLPFLPLDKRMSPFKANLYDVYLTGIVILGLALFAIGYFIYLLFKKASNAFYPKQKQE
ncbi:glycosyltransferase family 1 protein [Conidiobolus coronatus NRRL 28638]|uniref:Glycosyltransferase family 1 protein n=1 Tax=Conidiobolus coronatus (strain ATCC 28846 / CBS 209.66 / NRRL 28638) TaxID=796925 RepID=A0A137NVR7_CONC2|nr:glycosyltransferase family 1 protein [Conidiobolus coronatus NRRL 28638]|eukprot:KXN66847.1 glycosyltransferase family 1 protein [Conidiobolus coronatus NRRL 28638]